MATMATAAAHAPLANRSMTEDAWMQVYRVIDQATSSSSSATHAFASLSSQALEAVKRAGLGGLVMEYAAEGLNQELLRTIKPTFWNHFTPQPEEESSIWVYQHLRPALQYVKQTLIEKEGIFIAIGQALALSTSEIRQQRMTLRSRLAAIIFNTAPPDFEKWLAMFFRGSLRACHKAWRQRKKVEDRMMMVGDDDGEEEEEEEDDDEEGGGDLSWCQEEEVQGAWTALRALNWLPLVQATVTDVIKMEIERYIQSTCKGQYELKLLDKVGRWKEAVLMPWLAGLLGAKFRQEGEGGISTRLLMIMDEMEDSLPTAAVGGGAAALLSPSGYSPSKAFHEWQLRHDFSVYEIFAAVRMAEMFDIIRDFPDSLPAVQELKDALEITQQHRQLASSLRESMKKRLLHNGANTMQIIDVYIATIKTPRKFSAQALRVLDPTDVLLEAVAKPIRTYLQARKDTVRCIVTSLTDEQSGDLYEELRRQDALPLEQGVDSDDEDGGPGQDWMPASREADVSQSGRRRGDILSMLISIYGSKDLFVSEYRLMLADKLLSNLDYNTDKEVQNLELLKLRFGEATLHHCEIMIRDVEDSKRINTNVHSTLKAEKEASMATEGEEEITPEAACAVDVTIVSHHFWPPLQEEELQLHPRVMDRIETYGGSYAVLKNPRKLEFKPQLGSVQLDLDFDRVRRSFTVSPVHATLIMHFEDRQVQDQQELSRLTGLAPDVVAKKMSYWVNQGVVQVKASGTGSNVYTLITSQEERGHLGVGGGTHGEEEELQAAVSSDAQEAQETGVYVSYVLGMLGTYGGRNLRTIHDTLKIWVGDQKYSLKMGELERILCRLCAEEQPKIECVDGIYQIKRQSLG